MKSIFSRLYVSIRYKLIIINAVIIAGISLLIFYIFPAQQQKNAMASVKQKAESISHILAYNLQSALYFNDNASADEIVLSALQNDDLAYLIVEDAEGKIFATYQENSARDFEYKDLQLFNKIFYKTANPIVHQQSKVGVLYLGLSLDAINMEVTDSRRKIAIMSFAIFVIGFIITLLSSEIITRSLRKMVLVTKSVGRGDFSGRLSINSSDEIGVLATSFNDMITQLNETYRKLDNVNQSLKESNQELNTIIYKASHDLRAPLTSNMGLVNLAVMETKEENMLEYLRLIMKSNDRLEIILKDLFQLTRIRNDKTEPVRIDFNTLIEEIIEEMKYIEGFETTKLKLQIDDIKNFSCDMLIIRSVIQNIVENAIKYRNLSKQYNSIIIKVLDRGDSIQLVVEDNGTGIIQNEVEKIFNMFHRSQERIRGTGLGLYIVKTSLDKIGGKISVKTEIGKGSIFTVILPYTFVESSEEVAPLP